MNSNDSQLRKILILEDDRKALDTLKEVAEKYKFSPIGCLTIKQAEENLQEFIDQLSFVVLDQELSTSQENGPKEGIEFHNKVMQARIPTFIYSAHPDHCASSLLKKYYLKKGDHFALFDNIEQDLLFLEPFIQTWSRGGKIEQILDALFTDGDFAEFVNGFDNEPNWEIQHVVRKIANQLIYLADHKMIGLPESPNSNKESEENPKLPLSEYHVSERYIADLRHSKPLRKSLQSKIASHDESKNPIVTESISSHTPQEDAPDVHSKIPVVTGSICTHTPKKAAPVDESKIPVVTESICSHTQKEGNTSLFVVLTPLCDFAYAKADNITLAEIVIATSKDGDRYILISNPPIKNIKEKYCNDMQASGSVTHTQRPNEEAAQAEHGKDKNKIKYYIDLQTLRSVPRKQFKPKNNDAQANDENGELYHSTGVVIAPAFMKEVVSKLGRYLGRQGEPDVPKEKQPKKK